MPLFAAIGLDHPPHSMERRSAARPDHRRYVLENDGAISVAAVLLDEADNQCGSLYIFEAEDERAVREWFSREPFFQTGVYKDLIVRRLEVGRNRLPPRQWPIANVSGLQGTGSAREGATDGSAGTAPRRKLEERGDR